MITVPKTNQFEEDGQTYATDLYLPKVGTFIRLNTKLENNTVKTLKKLAKGLDIIGFSTMKKQDLVLVIAPLIHFDK
jgi:hypothetical protein